MPVIPVTTDADVEPEQEELPEGSVFAAKVTSVKDKPINWKDKETGEAKSAVLLNWRWEITEAGPFQGRSVFQTTNSDLELNRRFNRFRNTVETLMSRSIKETDPPLDTDDLIGMEAKIQIGYRADKRDASRKYVEVADVLPGEDSVFTVDNPPF